MAISAGYWHNLALDADGAMWVWGRNSYGCLGLGSNEAARVIPTPIMLFIPDVLNQTQRLHYTQIQPAVDEAADGDVIVVTQGIYSEGVNLGSKRLTIQSSNPDDPAIVATTITLQREIDDFQAFEPHYQYKKRSFQGEIAL